MKRLLVGSVLVLSFAATGAMATEAREMGSPGMMGRGMMGMMGRMAPEDMAAFLDARIAALHAGLKLTPDQEKLWPPVETAVRDLFQMHREHMRTMREGQGMPSGDMVQGLRGMADRMSQGADALRKLADAAEPLYASLDDGQKRRLRFLTRGWGGPGPWGRMMGRSPGPADDETDDDGDR